MTKQGTIAGLYIKYPYNTPDSVSMPNLNNGYGLKYGYSYGSGYSYAKQTVVQSWTFNGGYAPCNASLNVTRDKGIAGFGKNYGEFYGRIRIPTLPNILESQYPNFYSELIKGFESPITELPGVLFPDVYGFPLDYQRDPNLLPQDWWHDVNKISEKSDFIQWNSHAPQLMTPSFSSRNTWTNPGFIEK